MKAHKKHAEGSVENKLDVSHAQRVMKLDTVIIRPTQKEARDQVDLISSVKKDRDIFDWMKALISNATKKKVATGPPLAGMQTTDHVR